MDVWMDCTHYIETNTSNSMDVPGTVLCTPLLYDHPQVCTMEKNGMQSQHYKPISLVKYTKHAIQNDAFILTTFETRHEHKFRNTPGQSQSCVRKNNMALLLCYVLM